MAHGSFPRFFLLPLLSLLLLFTAGTLATPYRQPLKSVDAAAISWPGANLTGLMRPNSTRPSPWWVGAVRPWNNYGWYEYPPKGAKKPNPDEQCKAYVTRVWDWREDGMHRHKYAYWCDNCWEGIDYEHAGEFWGGKHIKGNCLAVIRNKQVYFDKKWKRWVIDSSEVDGFLGSEITCCLADYFAEVWGTYACEFRRYAYTKADMGDGAQCLK
ncbi:hypothetical protein DV738_g5421, partial [Chaetothyriales sp. CBS 135597]